MHASSHVCRFLSAIAFCLTSTLAQAAGLRLIDIAADADGPAIHGMIWYPCAEPPGEVKIGRVILPGVQDCPLAGDHLPLIAASHGQRGTFLGNHDTAETLADNGFVVAAVNHPGDTAQDPSRSGDLSVFVERPTDIKRLIDFMIGVSPFAARIDQARIGFFGFSRGGYTDLCCSAPIRIGPERPRTIVAKASCCSANRSSAGHTRRSRSRTIRGSRSRCLPIPWPSSFPRRAWRLSRRRFNSGHRNGVGTACCSTMSRLWTQTFRPNTNIAWFRNAGHFAFFLCPPALVKERPELCADAPGFDRGAFHAEFNADVLAFFRKWLVRPAE